MKPFYRLAVVVLKCVMKSNHEIKGIQIFCFPLTHLCCFVLSIKEMAEAIRFAVEREEKVQEQSLLKDKDFVVDLVRIINIENS